MPKMYFPDKPLTPLGQASYIYLLTTDRALLFRVLYRLTRHAACLATLGCSSDVTMKT